LTAAAAVNAGERFASVASAAGDSSVRFSGGGGSPVGTLMCAGIYLTPRELENLP
jgi:hypothetical protein